MDYRRFTKDFRYVDEVVPAAKGNAYRGRLHKVEGIVIHTMDGYLDGTGSWFRNPEARASTHFGVGLKPPIEHPKRSYAEIHQYVDLRDTALHAGVVFKPTSGLVRTRIGWNPNSYLIGIETEDLGDPEMPRPIEQVNSVAWLSYDLCVLFDLHPSPRTIFGHREVRATKECPGSFPVHTVVERVRARYEREGRL